jgi:putative membrane protein
VGFILRFATTGASLWVAVWLVGGLTFDGSFWQFLIVTALVGLANAIVKPILKIFSLPLIILTMGLFLLIVNALASDAFWWSTFWGAVVISVAGWLIGIVLPDPD